MKKQVVFLILTVFVSTLSFNCSSSEKLPIVDELGKPASNLTIAKNEIEEDNLSFMDVVTKTASNGIANIQLTFLHTLNLGIPKADHQAAGVFSTEDLLAEGG